MLESVGSQTNQTHSFFPTNGTMFDEPTSPAPTDTALLTTEKEVNAVVSVNFQEKVLLLIQQLFLYRKQCGMRTSAYHKDCLLITRTSNVMDVYLDLGKHQDQPKSGIKVFQADYIDGFWQVSYCLVGTWIGELVKIVQGYKFQCFGEINDKKYFRR